MITEVFSQSVSDDISLSCRNYDYLELVSKLDSFKNISTAKLKYKWRTVLEREIVDNNVEQIIKFEENVKCEGITATYTVYTYKIKLLKKGNELIYCKINNKDVYKKRINSIKKSKGNVFGVFKNGADKLKDLKKTYRKTYKTNLKFKELFKSDIVFGKNCGIGGVKPEYRIKLNKIIEEHDKSTLIKWLKSATVEIQLYAIDGILTLQNQGYKFDQFILDLIDLIENKEGVAYTCSGCLHWRQSINETVKQIKKEHNNN